MTLLWILVLAAWVYAGWSAFDVGRGEGAALFLGPVAAVLGSVTGFALFWDQAGRPPFLNQDASGRLLPVIGHDILGWLAFSGAAAVAFAMMGVGIVRYQIAKSDLPASTIKTRRAAGLGLIVLSAIADTLGIIAFVMQWPFDR